MNQQDEYDMIDPNNTGQSSGMPSNDASSADPSNPDAGTDQTTAQNAVNGSGASAVTDIAAPTATGAALGGPVGAGIGALLGLGDYFLVQKPQQNKQVALQATKAQYSPWTHMTPDAVAPTNPVGSVATFGATGAGLGQNMSNQGNNAALQKAQIANLNAKTQQMGGGTAPAISPGASVTPGVQAAPQPIVLPSQTPQQGIQPALDPTTGQSMAYNPWTSLDEEAEYA